MLKTINRLLKKLNLKLHKYSTGTKKLSLHEFIEHSGEKEWRMITSYYHVLKNTKNIPGDIAEFGVSTGTSLLTFAKINKIYNESFRNDLSKKTIYGFDTFSGLPYFDPLKDKGENDVPEMRLGGFNANSDFEKLKEISEKIGHIKLIKGKFEDTIPKFIEKNPHFSLSLIHIDCDLHQSTYTVLKKLLNRLNIGGIVIFDEIFHKDYPGETSGFWDAYNEIKESNKNLVLKFERLDTFPWKWYCERIS